MDWWKRLQAGIMGLGQGNTLLRPQAPVRADYMTKGPDYMSTRPANMPAMLSYTPRMVEGTPEWAQGGQVAYQTAQTDYEIAMKNMREDAMEHIRDWSTDFPKAATAGQTFKAPPLLSPIDRLAGKAPVNEMALYGQPQEFPGISSITNLRKRKEGVMA